MCFDLQKYNDNVFFVLCISLNINNAFENFYGNKKAGLSFD